ncbi:hypothetical protein AB6A40_005815 [Gnathostoma spinigerum]|uniref:Uncharacterized protein n=1 Tax=Gnathostoma spinigerum TaxID=75299 RepID=A0ABD6ENU9_9BILA
MSAAMRRTFPVNWMVRLNDVKRDYGCRDCESCCVKHGEILSCDKVFETGNPDDPLCACIECDWTGRWREDHMMRDPLQ